MYMMLSISPFSLQCNRNNEENDKQCRNDHKGNSWARQLIPCREKKHRVSPDQNWVKEVTWKEEGGKVWLECVKFQHLFNTWQVWSPWLTELKVVWEMKPVLQVNYISQTTHLQQLKLRDFPSFLRVDALWRKSALLVDWLQSRGLMLTHCISHF